MPVRAYEDERVAAFAEEPVPQTTDLGGVDALQSVRTTAYRVGRIGPRTAGDRALCEMPRRLDTECHGGPGIVEVAEMLDVVAVAAGWVERAGALRVSRDGIRLQWEV